MSDADRLCIILSQVFSVLIYFILKLKMGKKNVCFLNQNMLLWQKQSKPLSDMGILFTYFNYEIFLSQRWTLLCTFVSTSKKRLIMWIVCYFGKKLLTQNVSTKMVRMLKAIYR